jgi:hypothetical protein
MPLAGFEWNGDAIFERVKAAAELGVDRTLAQAAAQAKHDHRWVSRTGFLEATIGVLEFAHSDGLSVKGTFGALANYALDVEIGTSRIGPTTFDRAAGSAGWWTIPAAQPAPGVRVMQAFTLIPPGRGFGWSTIHKPSRSPASGGPLKAARPYLRPAAYTEFPLLPLRVAAAFKGEEMI